MAVSQLEASCLTQELIQQVALACASTATNGNDTNWRLDGAQARHRGFAHADSACVVVRYQLQGARCAVWECGHAGGVVRRDCPRSSDFNVSEVLLNSVLDAAGHKQSAAASDCSPRC